MYDRSEFASLEVMCRKRAMLARKEMDYWLAEAEEWKWLKQSSDVAIATIPEQVDRYDDH